jgi:hypothetical protein
MGQRHDRYSHREYDDGDHDDDMMIKYVTSLDLLSLDKGSVW